MITQARSSSIRSAYTSSLSEPKNSKGTVTTTVSKQGDTSKIEQLKEAVVSGSYQVDLDALSKKIADELM